MSENRVKFHLKDYKEPTFWQDKIDLVFKLEPTHTTVEATSHLAFNSKEHSWPQNIFLDGEKLELLSLEINGSPFEDYEVTEKGLILKNTPQDFTLKIVTKILPSENKSMEGLYETNGLYCTQCESQGFRKITYFTDRPDNMGIFSVRIEADKSKFPSLLSNGNLVESGELTEGRHFAIWKDPFRKPSYLFALVAGDLDMIEDTFKTKSGRNVTLKVFANRGRKDRCHHAMSSLKWSMKWDEDRFNLEYDLDLFMIVAVDDFNFGAMENKGLNIYNSRAALADQRTADDASFFRITSIVGHEYFHNWSGNRVTCKNWFQLSLKEGLTVYRDQEFTADLFSRPVQRLDDVTSLRENQFPEDAGPNAHPVRPESAYSTENFYTSTIYEKGAELIRMIETIVGRENFDKGIAKYFELHDGHAVTTEDFVRAMELASGSDLTQFRLWYSQAGTPKLKVSGKFDLTQKKYTLTLTQKTDPTPEQKEKIPFHIPVKIGLMSPAGKELISDTVLHLKKDSESFVFENINEEPTPSLLRDFSAPVNLEYDYSENENLFLLSHDTNSFNRWEAAQRLYKKALRNPKESKGLIEALKQNLKNNVDKDPLFVSRLIQVPSISILEQDFETLDPIELSAQRTELCKEIAQNLEAVFMETVQRFRPKGTLQITPQAMGERMLMGVSLAYLALLGKGEYLDLALEIYNHPSMAAKTYSLQALMPTASPQSSTAINSFYDEFSDDGVILPVWIAYAAMTRTTDVASQIKKIQSSNHFSSKSPNHNMSLWRGLCDGYFEGWHQKDGAAYTALASNIIELDSFNPAIAARLAGHFDGWKKYAEPHSSLMKKELERIVAEPKLSPNTFELVSNALKN